MSQAGHSGGRPRHILPPSSRPQLLIADEFFYFLSCLSSYLDVTQGDLVGTAGMAGVLNLYCVFSIMLTSSITLTLTHAIVVVVVLTLTRIIKSVVTAQAPVTLELRNTLGKNTNNPSWYPHISQLTQFMPPPETYKSEIGSPSTMCQVYTWCIRLITRAWKNRLYRLPPKKDYHVNITRSIYHYAYARQTQVNWKKGTKNK